jgi:CHAT domain-containing protein
VGQDELRLTFLSSAIDFYDDYIDFLIQHGRSEDALRIADLTRSQTLTEGLAPGGHGTDAPSAKISSRILAQKLHATLLVYWVGQEHSYLWVVTPAKVSYFPLPKKSEIDPVLKTYRQEILDGRDVLGANSDSGKRLYQMLVEPARALIAKDSRVILLPAESLYGLNFETLIVPDPTPHFWIEDVTLSTASSLALLSTADAKATTKDKSLLLVGNPQSPNADFPALAQAPAEMTKVSAHFAHNREEMLEGSRATPSSYLASNPARFSYLHFVTHGTASHTRPLESAVILSKEGDSYKLYARDIVKHPLSANLVTISACNGAGTRAYAGEGLVGLSWAFLRAGAHNVIGALWEVSDATSTPQLMDSLYTGLDHGQDPATALRNAKLAILHATGASVFKKPFYWAPFQLYTGS